MGEIKTSNSLTIKIILFAALVLLLFFILLSSFQNPCNCSKPDLWSRIISLFGTKMETCREWTAVNAQLIEIKSAVESVSEKNTQYSFNLTLPECIDKSFQKINIEHSTDSDRCKTFCGNGSSSCFLLNYYHTLIQIDKCINIPNSSIFGSPQNCVEKTGYALQGVAQDIPKGGYLVINESTDQRTPIICFYRRIK